MIIWARFRNLLASNQYTIMLKEQIVKENKSLLQILSPKERYVELGANLSAF